MSIRTKDSDALVAGGIAGARGGHAAHSLLAAICLLVWLGIVVASPAAADQKAHLRVTLQLPIGTHLGANLVEFKQAVEARTKGAITVEIFDGGKLYPEDKLVEAVSSGAIEMAVIGFNQFSSRAPAVDVVQQPFMLNFERLVREATSPARDLRRVIDGAILESTKVRPLWWQGYGSTVFFTRGRDVADPDRIKGQRVRVLGETMADLIKSCGGTPVILPAARMTQAMKDGQVDAIMVGVSSIESRRLWEVADTITRTEHAALEFIVVINEAVWQKLPADHRAVLEETGREVEARLRQKMIEVEEQAYAFARSKGMTVVSLTADQTVAWRECSTPVLEAYMTHPSETVRGVLAAYGRLRTDPCCTNGPQSGSSRQ